MPTAMTQPAIRFAESSHRFATTAGLVVLFWLVAAGAVVTAQTMLQPVSATAGTTTTIAAIVVAAYCYIHFCARYAGVTHALGAGITWLVLGISTELLMATGLGHGWYGVLGSPDRPLLRNVLFFVWIFAPALFARREDGDLNDKPRTSQT